MMSIQGEALATKLGKYKEYVEEKAQKAKNKDDIDLLVGILEAIEDVDMRLQALEREMGPGRAFIEVDGPHRLK